jgi:hypothetical protein
MFHHGGQSTTNSFACSSHHFGGGGGVVPNKSQPASMADVHQRYHLGAPTYATETFFLAT